MEERLTSIYGECDGLLENVVAGLEKHEGAEFEKPIKARLLTDDDVDRWEAYKAIGTVEECREAKEVQQAMKLSDEGLNVTQNDIDTFKAYIEDCMDNVAFGNTDWNHSYALALKCMESYKTRDRHIGNGQ